MSEGTYSLAQKAIDGFAPVRAAEHKAIGERRVALKRPPIAALPAPTKGTPGSPVYNLAGVSLSGGGVRSASFCLGALQALDAFWGLGSVDYLSTVSGGGYIGSAVSASMARAGRFYFAAPDDQSDSLAIGHLRNYSNYLLPRGESLSFLKSLAVVLRGLLANVCLVFVVMIPFAALTIRAYPARNDLGKGSFLTRLFHLSLSPWPFALTGWLVLAVVLYAVSWAVWRSFVTARGCDANGPAVTALAGVMALAAAVAFLDLQPVALAAMFALRDAIRSSDGLLPWLKDIAAALAPLGAAAAFFANKLSQFLSATQRSRRTSVVTARIAAYLALLLGSLAIPLAIWLTFLVVCMIGIRDDGPYAFGIAPMGRSFIIWRHAVPVLDCYLAAFGLLLAITIFFKPNANSLHRLYRDRLSKAFLFDPSKVPAAGKDFPWLDDFQLTGLSPPQGGPYQLVNAALNIQASKTANRRGRNADFFLFSASHVGSDSTGYVDTPKMQALDRQLDLATAMAISGAAASSDMGSKSVALLAPTLALLNIRLGYWMRNPKFAEQRQSWRERLGDVTKFYLFLEMFGLLTENHRKIYLTDGGHIENLGLYQLLKRGCRFIVAIDAEADPELGFPSFIDMQRYARIDLGIRIDLPWQPIAAAAKAVDKAVEDGAPIAPAPGPHCALGTIHYPNGVDGHLLYIKSSLSGDENDYVLDYKRRNPDFPHETTSDQFFSEEQFEVYRALGFHAVASAFQDEAGIAWTGEASPDATAAAADERASVMSPAYLKLREILDALA